MLNKIVSGCHQPCQVVVFGTISVPIIKDLMWLTGYLKCPPYIPAQNQYSWLEGVKLLLCLALLFHWCFTELFKHVSCRTPCLAQGEISIYENYQGAVRSLLLLSLWGQKCSQNIGLFLPFALDDSLRRFY